MNNNRRKVKRPNFDEFYKQCGELGSKAALDSIGLGNRVAQKPVSKGVGDTIGKAIKAVSFGKIKPCGACKKRKEKLNKMFPYKKDSTPGKG